MSNLRHPALAAAALAAMALGACQAELPATAGQELVVKSRLVLEGMKIDPGFETFREYMKDAKAIVIIPALLKAGFVFGAEGGSGVLLARNQKGEWSYPAFITLGGGSFGLQAGFQDSEVAFVILTENGVNAVVSDEVKLGFDGSISVGSLGKGIEGSTTTGFGGDIVAFSKSVGIFAGVSFEGAVIHEREDINALYYGTDTATARGIVMQGGFKNPQAEQLRVVLAGYPSAAPSAAAPAAGGPPQPIAPKQKTQAAPPAKSAQTTITSAPLPEPRKSGAK